MNSNLNLNLNNDRHLSPSRLSRHFNISSFRPRLLNLRVLQVRDYNNNPNPNSVNAAPILNSEDTTSTNSHSMILSDDTKSQRPYYRFVDRPCRVAVESSFEFSKPLNAIASSCLESSPAPSTAIDDAGIIIDISDPITLFFASLDQAEADRHIDSQTIIEKEQIRLGNQRRNTFCTTASTMAIVKPN